jgi:hypothetical protein
VRTEETSPARDDSFAGRVSDEFFAPELIFTNAWGNSFAITPELASGLREMPAAAHNGELAHTMRAPTQSNALSEVTGSLIPRGPYDRFQYFFYSRFHRRFE